MSVQEREFQICVLIDDNDDDDDGGAHLVIFCAKTRDCDLNDFFRKLQRQVRNVFRHVYKNVDTFNAHGSIKKNM